jgi:hypothetical protein
MTERSSAQVAAQLPWPGARGIEAATTAALAPVKRAVRANHRRLSRAKRSDTVSRLPRLLPGASRGCPPSLSPNAAWTASVGGPPRISISRRTKVARSRVHRERSCMARGLRPFFGTATFEPVSRSMVSQYGLREKALTLFRLGLIAGFIAAVLVSLELGMSALGPETVFVIGIILAAWGFWYDGRVRRRIHSSPVRRDQARLRD